MNPIALRALRTPIAIVPPGCGMVILTQREAARLAVRERVLEHICKFPGRNRRQIAHSMGITVGAVERHVTTLLDLVQIHARPDGNSHTYFPGPKVRQ